MKSTLKWIAILGIAGCLLAGCFPSRASLGSPLPSAPQFEGESKPSAELRVHIAALETQLKSEKTRLAELENASLRSLLKWVSALSILGAIACTAGMFWLPVLKKTLALGAVSFVAVLAVAMTIQWLLPYLVWVGLVMLATGAVVGLLYFARHANTLRQVSCVLDESVVEASVLPEKAKSLIRKLRA